MTDADFATTFQGMARQLAGDDFAAQWAEMAKDDANLTPQEAARWANMGFTPTEAAGEKARGVTVQDIEDAEEQRSRRPRAHIWRNGQRII